MNIWKAGFIMNSPPFTYNELNNCESRIYTSALHTHDNIAFKKYQDQLFNIAVARFDWELPETWDRGFFLELLYTGWISIVNAPGFGWIPQLSTLSGYNIYYEPTRVLISSPIIKKKQYRIGYDAVVIKLHPNFTGFWGIINSYADKLALCDECSVSNLYASRLAYLFFAENTREAETFKAAVDKITSGNVSVVLDKKVRSDDNKTVDTFLNNLSVNFIAPDIQNLHRTILNAFCTDIGVTNANTVKKERLITAEVNANGNETDVNARIIIDSVNEGIAQLKKLAGNINLSISDPYNKEVLE